MKQRRGAGFTLLEALVALVLIASGAAALYAWLNSSLISLGRLQEVNARLQAQRLALSFIQTVNPMQQPAGEAELARYSLRWQAEPLEPPRQGSTLIGVPGNYRIGLYQISIELSGPNGAIAPFSVRQIGYRQTLSGLGLGGS